MLNIERNMIKEYGLFLNETLSQAKTWNKKAALRRSGTTVFCFAQYSNTLFCT